MILCSFEESNCCVEGEGTSTAALIMKSGEDKTSIVTCWKLTADELEELNRTKRCYLVVTGDCIVAPCYISVFKPFERI